MTYNPNVPLPNQKVKDTQQPIQKNFELANTYFGVDHYAFNAASLQGEHNTVTTPEITGAAHPATDPDVPKFYAMNAGDTNGTILQFSRGGDNAPPTPVTFIYSSTTPIVITPVNTIIFDFTGMNDCYGVFSTVNNDSNPGSPDRMRHQEMFQWISSTGRLGIATICGGGPANNGLTISVSGANLRMRHLTLTLNEVFWDIQFLRINI